MANPDPTSIAIEICWVSSGDASRLERRRFDVPRGANVGDALRLLDRSDLVDGLSHGRLAVAVFGEHVSASTRLHEGDRIELLGEITADPKQSRTRRAEVQRQRRGDARWQRR